MWTWVQKFPEQWMFNYFILLMFGAGFCMTIGYHYRFAAIFYFFGISYMFFIEASNYLNQYVVQYRPNYDTECLTFLL